MSSDSHASDPCSRLGGSSWLCYGIISLQSSMKCHLLVAPPCCQRANSKVLGPAVYKNIAEFNEIENSSPYNGEDGADLKRCGRESTGRLYGRGTNPCVTCWKDPYNGPERGKLREVNPVSAINTDEEKSGKRRAEARGKFRPSTAYGAFPPHTQWFITSSWPLGG